jgi:tryptophanyl-tRNA synthetase
MKRLLTGIRASGTIHLGNYLSAIRPALEDQNKKQCFLFIADLHGLTTNPPADVLRANTRSVAAAWLAAGLDPEKAILWKQSEIKEHTELAYILSCVTGLGLLERAHSFKDAKAKQKQLKAGILYYPVLMAADILLYAADEVPVGKDQMQHLEMTRDIATFFNETYSDCLTLPKELVRSNVGLVPGTDGRKMSKSYGNGIELFADEKLLKKQIMSIVTDSKSLEEPKDPEECLIFKIYRLVATPEQSTEMETKLREGNYGYGHAKKELLRLVIEDFSSTRQTFFDWMKRPDDLEDVLRLGAAKARKEAEKMMERIKTAVGL